MLRRAARDGPDPLRVPAPPPPRPQDEEIERLAEQLRALQRKAPKTASYDALVRKDAWVCWPTFQDRGRAFIHDGVRAAREGLLDDTEIALRVGDSAMLSLSGVHVPHMRCGQLELLVVTPNPKGLRCIHKLVRLPSPAAPPSLAMGLRPTIASCPRPPARPSAAGRPGGGGPGSQGPAGTLR